MRVAMERAESHTGVYQLAIRAIACALLCVLAMTTLSSPARAQSSTGIANANVNSSIAIVEPLTILKTRDMDFGKIVGIAAGTVAMTADDAATCTESAGLVQTGVCTSARFAGSGETGRVIRIRKPQGDTIDLTGPGTDMTVTNFVIDGSPELFQLNNSNGFNRYRIDSANGGFVFRVGGTLNVNANQTPGVYTGTFTIQVDYQ